jgi:hypothetical protein
VEGTRTLTRNANPTDLADVDVGIIRAAFGVAETGSLWLSEAELQVNALSRILHSTSSLCWTLATSLEIYITPIAIRGSRRRDMRCWLRGLQRQPHRGRVDSGGAGVSEV